MNGVEGPRKCFEESIGVDTSSDILVDAGTLFEYVCARPHKLIDVNIYLSTWTTKHGDDNNNSA